MKTLRDRMNRIAYVVINVSDLERSRRFYETVLGLTVTGEIAAPLQPFRGLGIAEGRFDSLVLQDRTGGNPTAIHLVQWRTPAPVGAPYPVFWNVGLAKIALLIPDLDEKIALLRHLGLRPTNATIHRRYLTVLDPDGTIISMPESPQLGTAQLVHANVSARDVQVTNAFYGDLLGLTLRTQSIPCEPQPASQGPGSDLSQWDSHLFSSRGDDRFRIDVSQFHFPPPTRESLTPYAEANHLGIVRVGFEVDDLAAARAILVDALGEDVNEPEAWDYGGAIGASRVLALRDPNGVRLELVEEKAVARQTACRNPTFNPPPIVF